jgi:hypothetical protein
LIVKRLPNSDIARLARLEWKVPVTDTKLPTLLKDVVSQYNQWKESMFYLPLRDADRKRFRTSFKFISVGDARSNKISGEELRKWSILKVGGDQTALLKFMYRNLKRFIDPEHRDITHSSVDELLLEEKRKSISNDL